MRVFIVLPVAFGLGACTEVQQPKRADLVDLASSRAVSRGKIAEVHATGIPNPVSSQPVTGWHNGSVIGLLTAAVTVSAIEAGRDASRKIVISAHDYVVLLDTGVTMKVRQRVDEANVVLAVGETVYVHNVGGHLTVSNDPVQRLPTVK